MTIYNGWTPKYDAQKAAAWFAEAMRKHEEALANKRRLALQAEYDALQAAKAQPFPKGTIIVRSFNWDGSDERIDAMYIPQEISHD